MYTCVGMHLVPHGCMDERQRKGDHAVGVGELCDLLSSPEGGRRGSTAGADHGTLPLVAALCGGGLVLVKSQREQQFALLDVHARLAASPRTFNRELAAQRVRPPATATVNAPGGTGGCGCWWRRVLLLAWPRIGSLLGRQRARRRSNGRRDRRRDQVPVR